MAAFDGALGEMPLGPLSVPPGCGGGGGGGGGLMAAFDGAERSRPVLIVADHQREAYLLREATVVAEQQKRLAPQATTMMSG